MLYLFVHLFFWSGGYGVGQLGYIDPPGVDRLPALPGRKQILLLCPDGWNRQRQLFRSGLCKRNRAVHSHGWAIELRDVKGVFGAADGDDQDISTASQCGLFGGGGEITAHL